MGIFREKRPGVLVSACLLGEKTRYDGKEKTCDSPVLRQWRIEGRMIPFCPEAAGGLPIPRPASEITGGDGNGVLARTARVVDRTGRDVTDAFLTGAEIALKMAEESGIRLAVLKSNSPSCGNDGVYDGSFSGTLRSGPGVTAALLKRNGIRVFNEHQIAEAGAYLRRRK
jgi:uncharacterized protein YbbK (DUF523 family)